MALPPFLNSVIQWLRAGYPEGVPDVERARLERLVGQEPERHDEEHTQP